MGRMLDWADNEVIRATFPEAYNIVTVQPVDNRELDELTGLPIKERETILSKYGIRVSPKNNFHKSLIEQFDKKGFLSERQLDCIR